MLSAQPKAFHKAIICLVVTIPATQQIVLHSHFRNTLKARLFIYLWLLVAVKCHISPFLFSLKNIIISWLVLVCLFALLRTSLIFHTPTTFTFIIIQQEVKVIVCRFNPKVPEE
jgi:hypothetical protein